METEFHVKIDTPEGPMTDRKMSEKEARKLCNDIIENSDDEKLAEIIEHCMKSFGFSGYGGDGYDVMITASKPTKSTGEKMTCPRRMNEFGPQKREENLDEWELRGEDKCCSYCGSLHPERLLELIEEHGPQIISRSTKKYKIYVRRDGVPNASFGGIKYYRQHDIHADNFVERINKLITDN